MTRMTRRKLEPLEPRGGLDALSDLARVWLGATGGGALDEIVARARDATDAVPESRRGDWKKVCDALARAEEARATGAAGAPPERARAFVESLGRACRLFSEPPPPPPRKPRAPKPPPPPLAATDPVDRLPGLGASARAQLAEHGIEQIADLLWLSPVAWDDFREPISIAEAVERARHHEASGAQALGLRAPRVVARGKVKAASVVPLRGRRGVRVVVQDDANAKCTLHAFWFFLAHGVLASAKTGAEVLVVGRVRAETGKPPRIVHPEIFVDGPEARRVRARYPRLGPSEAAVRAGIGHALAAGLAPDPVPASIRAREALPDLTGVLREIHATAGEVASEPARRAFVERLAWAEAFTRAWERLVCTEGEGRAPAPALTPRPDVLVALERELGFELTFDQRAAIATVSDELARDVPMRRLLLGDVGTGKTAVALAAAAQAVASGKQVAILAPTSVLADQYLRAALPLARATGVRVAFVAAGQPAAARRSALAALASGAALVAIGTHALLGASLAMPRLALVIVDEQQRLGVAQRLALVRKGERPHLLTLSATPIPRTLALALRGELATSVLRERPGGRLPPETQVLARAAEAEAIARAAEAIARGERVFWVVPRVLDPIADAEEDAGELASAGVASVEARARALGVALGGGLVGAVHGSMTATEKRRAMEAFREGARPLLVGTTVIEVGVDVPEATLMVIEDAERFGLAQLHQLRGRVGRGARPGTCLLLHGDDAPLLSRARLAKLAGLVTGEEVATADLELRGAGDLGGTRQHGAEEELVYLDPGVTYAWLERIEGDAKRLFEGDARLEGHATLASLVRRLGRVIAVREEAG
jgi:ATP-dependent DNA helicase RecG